MPRRELTAEECRKRIDEAELRFETTAEVEPSRGVISQERALAALEHGLEIRQPRFHVVVVGSAGSGRTFSVRSTAERIAKKRPTPDELLLLPNPDRPSEPIALFLPAGEGKPFVDSMQGIFSKILESLHAATEGERFKQAQTRAQRRSRREETRLEDQLVAYAKDCGFQLTRNGDEIELAPLDGDGEAEGEDGDLPPAEGKRQAPKTLRDKGAPEKGAVDKRARDLHAAAPKSPEGKSTSSALGRSSEYPEPRSAESRASDVGPMSQDPLEMVKVAIEEFEARLADVHEEAEAELRAHIKTFLGDAIKAAFSPVEKRYETSQIIAPFLATLETATIARLHQLIDEPRGEESAGLSRGFIVPTLLTEHAPGSGAPVVEVAHPTLTALFGRSHSPPDESFPPEPGFAVAGALHLANGGFLILPASALLKNEALYEQLKACLLSGKFIVPEQNPSYYRGSSEELLFPPIAIDVKVILVAGSGLYQDLHALDPEFSQLFRIQARFEPTLPLADAPRTYPSFLAGLCKERGLLPLTRSAVAELVYLGGRLAESQSKVTSCLGAIAEVATEASYLAGRRGAEVIEERDVNDATQGAQRRGSKFRDALHELLKNGTIRIETTGAIVGQVNAISVLSDGPISFGRPCRVTAVVYPGHEGPMNIAREVEMSGPIHAKGVLVLTGFLASRFAQTRPLSFSASLVFEQTYEAIDGDSASSSELYALLSALSGVPLRQDLAVTGSVDQAGGIQPVGGLNEKIEAFFDVCQAKGGLTGTQGVLIPATNVDALMLRADVVDAIRAGQFHVYAVSTVESAIELLTGVPAGAAAGPSGDARFPEGSVYGRAEARLARFYEALVARRNALGGE
jgi:predicted ATP-dependent protease